MATKGEERLKTIIKEYFEQQQQTVADNALGIFLMGVATGVILSYTNIFSIIAGIACGYSLARKQLPITDNYIIRIISFLRINMLLKYVNDDEKKNLEQ